MSDAAYWISRALEREARTARRSASLTGQVTALYEKALRSLDADIRQIIRAYAKSGKMTEAEALQRLTARESNQVIEELKRQIHTITDANERRRLLARIEAPAYRARITRLQALQDRVEVTVSRIAQERIQLEREQYIRTLTDEYHRSLYEIQVASGYGFEFAAVPERAIKAAIDHKWSGKNYSDTVWDDTHELAKQAKEIVQQGLFTGKSVGRMRSELMNRFVVAEWKAGRLIRTEMNFFHNQGDLAGYRESGIEKYRYLATLDVRTCSKCGALDNMVIAIEDAEVGANYPPLHPNDRCTTVAYFDDMDTAGMKRRARDPKTGETVLVPRDMTYTEWKKLMDETYGTGFVDTTQKKRYNVNADREQYKAYRVRLGKDAPASFADFQKLKYESPDDYGVLSGYFRYRGRVPEATQRDYQAYKAVKATGVFGSVRVPPKHIDASTLLFNDDHAARHGCTLEDAKKYIETSKCSITRERWDGPHTNYYSFDGAAYVADKTNKIKTAYSCSDFDPSTKKVLEVFQ